MKNTLLVPSFESLPRQFKQALKDDVIATVVQNSTQLTPVPREWKLSISKRHGSSV